MTDVMVPELTDLAPQKWIGWGVALGETLGYGYIMGNMSPPPLEAFDSATLSSIMDNYDSDSIYTRLPGYEIVDDEHRGSYVFGDVINDSYVKDYIFDSRGYEPAPGERTFEGHI